MTARPELFRPHNIRLFFKVGIPPPYPGGGGGMTVLTLRMIFLNVKTDHRSLGKGDTVDWPEGHDSRTSPAYESVG